jgi:hypothetical protein
MHFIINTGEEEVVHIVLSALSNFNSTEQSPYWEITSHSAGQEILRFL